MTKERKNLLTGAFIVIVVYIATLWQRPLFYPDEFICAVRTAGAMSPQNLASVFNGFFGRALEFNIVSVRLLPALSAIICAFCVRIIGKKEYGENFGNLAAVIFLSTLLVFAYGTACAVEMINAMFLCTALTAFYCAFELDESLPGYFRYLISAAGGSALGCFAASMGADALVYPFTAIVLYICLVQPAHARSVIATALITGCAVVFLWLLDHRMSLFSKYGSLKLQSFLYFLAGTLPWGLFLPQAAAGAIRNRKTFFRRKAVIFSSAVIVASVLVFPVAGVLPAAVMASPFAALLFAFALKESENDEKFLKISEHTLNAVLILLFLFAAFTVVSCCLSSVPKKWKLYCSKAELAGFAVAAAVAVLQFKIAVAEKGTNKVKKLLHIATGMAALMILLPGAIPEKIKLDLAPEEFYRSSAGRYMAPDAVIYADWNSFYAAKWVFPKHRVIRITKKNARTIAERIEKGKNTAIFSTSSRFTKLLPRKKILFSRGRWRIVLCQDKSQLAD